MSRTPTVPGYVLVDRLHRGPRADVWRAVRSQDDRPVAVKIPAPGPDGAATDAEACLLRRVHHEHVVAVVDEVLLEDGRCCLVTELADGGSLADLVAARSRLVPSEIVAVMQPLAEALWALHRQDVVHGDLAPGNVLFTADARPVLADLGAAADLRAGGAHDLWGTEGFGAPELLAGGSPTPESDVYALGALAVHALTGQPISPLEQVERVIGRCTAVCDLDPVLEEVLRGMLCGVAAERPRAVDVAKALQASDAGPLDIGGRCEDELVTTRVARAVLRRDAVRERPAGRLVRAREALTSRAAGRATAVGLLVAGLGASAVALGPSLPGLVGLTPERPPAAAAPAPTRVTPAPSPTAAARSLASRAGAPAQAPRELLAEILTDRARAIEERDTPALAAVDADGSWAHARDVEIVGALVARSEVPLRLRYRVQDARPVSVASSRALLEASVAVDGYTVQRAGTTRQVPATTTRTERYELVWSGDRWLVSSVSAA